MSEYQITSAKGQEMLSYLPSFYETVRDFRILMQVEGVEFDDLQLSINDVLDQFFVNTATWNLERWEKELGIKTDSSKPDDQRRSVIKSKIRGTGTVTISLVKNVAESYSNGEVDIIEDSPNYQFIVKFVGVKGVPPNLDDLKEAVENIKPAHLNVVYEFTYLRWEELDATLHSWDDIDSRLLTWDEFEVWKP